MSNAISVCHGAFGRAALLRMDREMIPHAHREGHLLFHVDGNGAAASVAGGSYLIDHHHAAAVSPWEPHSFAVDSSGECLCLVLYIKPIWFLENCNTAEFAMQFGNPKIVLTELALNLVGNLTKFLLDEDDPADFDSLLFGLTRNCYESSWNERVPDSVLRSVSGRFSDYRIRRSMRLMQSNMSEDVDMESLARDVGLSRPHFFKLFKKQMGVTPNIFFNTLRSERAIEDLLNTQKTVTDIAFELGFSSQASFTRFFSTNVGIPPSDYRRVASKHGSSFAMTG